MIRSFFNGLEAVGNRDIVNVKLYEQMIGSLLYLALRTRPDILVSVLILARFQQAPCSFCHSAVKRILRYLKGTLGHGMDYLLNRETNEEREGRREDESERDQGGREQRGKVVRILLRGRRGQALYRQGAEPPEV